LKIGLVSDTHDRLPFIDRAVNKLNEENVELVLHAGDYSAPFAAYRFKPLRAKMIGVFGNNDAERSMLQKNFKAVGADVHGKFAEIDGKSNNRLVRYSNIRSEASRDITIMKIMLSLKNL